MRVDETRDDGAATKVDARGPRPGERQHVARGANGDDAFTRNGNRLGDRCRRVHRQKAAAVQDELRRIALRDGQRRGSHDAQRSQERAA